MMDKECLFSAPRVVLLISTAAESNRRKLAGILQYIRLHASWNLQLIDTIDKAPTLTDLYRWQPDGIIIRRLPSDITAPERTLVPTVVIDAPQQRYESLKRAFYVTCDSQAVVEAAADFLLAKGYETFAYIVDPADSEWAVERSQSFHRLLCAKGYSCQSYRYETPSKCWPEDWFLEQEHLAEWLKCLPKQTAVFVSNDRHARRILDLCRLLGLNVPFDLAILGCDNDELLCEHTAPRLSSVKPDFETCGYQAAQLLDRLMSGQQRKERHLHYGVKEIVERESTPPRSQMVDRRIQQGLEFIRLNITHPIGIADIAKHMGVSCRMAELLFRKRCGSTIVATVQAARIERLKRLLTDTDRPITFLCGLCGYQSESHAKHVFKSLTGKTMSQYRYPHMTRQIRSYLAVKAGDQSSCL